MTGLGKILKVRYIKVVRTNIMAYFTKQHVMQFAFLTMKMQLLRAGERNVFVTKHFT